MRLKTTLRSKSFKAAGIRILMRLMGLVLTAIAVQFVINGLTDLGVIPSTNPAGIPHVRG